MSTAPLGILFSDPQIKPLDTAGRYQPGCYLQFYSTGTLVLTNVYADGGLATPLSQTPGANQPSTTSDSNGRFNPIYMDASVTYRVQMLNAAGALLEDVDPYVVPGPIPFTAQNVGMAINPQTVSELSLGVVPTFYAYSASPKVDPRRYGAKGDGATNDTLALQTAMNVAYESGGTLRLPEDFHAISGPLSLTFTGSDSTNCSFVMEGVGMTSSTIQPVAGTASPLLSFVAATAGVTPQPAQLILQNFGLTNNANARTQGGHGIYMNSLADVRVSGVAMRNFDINNLLQNCLEVDYNEWCQILNGNYGFLINRSGTLLSSNTQICNLINIERCRIVGNGTSIPISPSLAGYDAPGFGISFSGGSMLTVVRSDLEQNGTAGNFATGALITGQDLAGTFGAAKIELTGNWFELNNGTAVNILPLTSGFLLVSIDGGHIISSQNGAALNIGQAAGVAPTLINIRNLMSPSPGTSAISPAAGAGDTWNLYGQTSNLDGVFVSVLNDTSTYKVYGAVVTSAGALPSYGVEIPLPNLGITGLTTNPVVQGTALILGRQVTLYIPAGLTGTASSTVTSCSITGLPASIRPNNPQPITVNVYDGSGVGKFVTQGNINSDGTISLTGPLAGGLFTASGTKGCAGIAGISYLLS